METESVENRQEYYSDFEILTKIWTKPRLVFNYIIRTGYDNHVALFLILQGISRAFSRASSKNMGDSFSLEAILFICITFGGFLGWISLYFYAALVSLTGKWLNGIADTYSTLRVLAYAMTPTIFSLPLFLIKILICGNELFKGNPYVDEIGSSTNIIILGILVCEMLLGIWTLILLVIGISELQRMTIWKSILNLIMPVLFISIPIIIISIIYKFL